MTIEQKAWLAGVIDGEGCVNIYPMQRAPSPRLTVANTNLLLLERVMEITQCGAIIRSSGRLVKKTGYTWQTTAADDIERVLTEVFPYLVIKAQQASLVIACCKLCALPRDERLPGRFTRVSEAIVSARWELMRRIKPLNGKFKGGEA